MLKTSVCAADAALDEAMCTEIFAEIHDHDALIMRAADESGDVHGDIEDEAAVMENSQQLRGVCNYGFIHGSYFLVSTYLLCLGLKVILRLPVSTSQRRVLERGSTELSAFQIPL
jgi:hypothetical protein